MKENIQSIFANIHKIHDICLKQKDEYIAQLHLSLDIDFGLTDTYLLS